MQDLRVIIPTRGIDTTLSQHNIDFLDLNDPSISVDLETRAIAGRVGSNKRRSTVKDKAVELEIRYRASDKLDFIGIERNVKRLFSHTEPMTIGVMYSYNDLYRFEKIGEYADEYDQLYVSHYYDVILSDKFNIKRNGLMATVTIELTTVDVPYRYVTERSIDLSIPSSRTNNSLTYNFKNKGNVTQYGRQFYLELRAKGLNFKELNVDLNSSNLRIVENTITATETVHNGYATYANGKNIVKSTNYGNLSIVGGSNKLVLRTDQTIGTPTGTFKFKEYLE